MPRHICLVLSLLLVAPYSSVAQISVYSELIVEPGNGLLNLTAWGAASDDSPTSCSDIVNVDVVITRGGSVLASQGNSDWCGASTYITYSVPPQDLLDEDEVFSARATGSGGGYYHGCAVDEKVLRGYTSRYRNTNITIPNGKFLYVQENCAGKCQGARYCAVPNFPVLYSWGTHLSYFWNTVSYCLHIGDEPSGTCKQPPGASIIVAGNDGCGGYSFGNLRPQVSITAPANESWFASPAGGTVTVDTFDAVGPVPRVDYYVNGAYLATTTTSPFSLGYGGVGPGTYVVQAVAYDDAGDGYEISPAVTVHVY